MMTDAYQYPVRVHDGVESMCYSQYSTLTELFSDSSLDYFICPEVRII